MTAPTAPAAPMERITAAAAAILLYAAMIGLADNLVREISQSTGLWQLQAMRSGLGLAIMAGLAALPVAIRIRPRRWRAVAARGAVQAVAMLLYYGSLAFLTVAEASAGLFTAPIFVLLIGWLAYGHPVGPLRVLAALVGFAGVLLVLAPGLGQIGWASLTPVLAGALYALANVATREWCAGESAHALVAAYLVIIGLFGALGMLLLWWWAPDAASGSDGFMLRGPVWPSGRVWLWTGVQAVASVVGIGLMVRAYQLAEAGRVAVFEYVLLPISALWAWVLFGQGLSPVALLGMALIVAAGAAMGWPRARAQQAA